MIKRLLKLFSLLVLLSVIAWIYIYFINPMYKLSTDGTAKTGSTVQSSGTGEEKDVIGDINDDGIDSTNMSDRFTGDDIKIIKTEEIKVLNNTPEFDLNINLYENSLNQTFLKFEYYTGGTGTVKEFDDSQAEEIKNIFERKSENPQSSSGNRVKAAYLNPGYAKVYIVIEGKSGQYGVETFIYSLDLNDYRLKRIFANYGIFTDLFLTKNMKYLGFSYNDSPASSVHQENSLLEILSCETDIYIVSDSRDLKGMRIGNNRNSKFVYDYTFLSWYSSHTAKLREESWSKQTGNTGGGKNVKEALYDIEKNAFVNPDGSIAGTDGTGEPNNSGQRNIDTDSVKVLKDFYASLQTAGGYKKAMDILDNDFILELYLLKQFGTDKLIKADLDEKSVSAYKDILKTAKLGTILKEDLSGSSSTIYYYESFSAGEGLEATLPLVTQLKKRDNLWKIISIKDGDAEKAPFKQ